MLLLATGSVLALISSGGSTRPDRPASAKRQATVTTGSRIAPPEPPYAVGTILLDLSEPSTEGNIVRSLPTEVRYPATGPPGAPDQTAAAPERTPGPYPLVVFSAGYDIEPEAYASLLDSWAAAGFIVVDPVYPFTAPSSPGQLDEGDIANHPADLSFVITSILDAGATVGNILSGLVEPSEVGVIGHSDGGDVSLATATNSCCRDARIKAAVILSGAELTTFGGTYFSTAPVPMLVAQGTVDEINPPACSVQFYDQAPQPKYYLSLVGQSHEGPYLQVGRPLDVVAKVTLDFLNGYLRHSKSNLESIAADGAVPGLATLTSTASVGPVVGSCPGAPGG